MNIVGCDFHPGWQQVAVLDSETGEVSEHKLDNGSGEAERFYRQPGAPCLATFRDMGPRIQSGKELSPSADTRP